MRARGGSSHLRRVARAREVATKEPQPMCGDRGGVVSTWRWKFSNNDWRVPHECFGVEEVSIIEVAATAVPAENYEPLAVCVEGMAPAQLGALAAHVHLPRGQHAEMQYTLHSQDPATWTAC